jgi:hypothetical protein
MPNSSSVTNFGGMDALTWVMIAFLGLGLAASSGLNTFMPLLLLAGAVKYHLFGIQLNGAYGWLASDLAVGVLLLASLVEIAGDKIPAVDHALDVLGTVARPAAGALAAASVFRGADPTTAAVLGIIIGAPTAFSFHAAKAGTRAASSATTFGIGNPLLSVMEDIVSVLLTLVAFLAPLLVPVLLVAAAFLVAKLVKVMRAKLPGRTFNPTSQRGG